MKVRTPVILSLVGGLLVLSGLSIARGAAQRSSDDGTQDIVKQIVDDAVPSDFFNDPFPTGQVVDSTGDLKIGFDPILPPDNLGSPAVIQSSGGGAAWVFDTSSGPVVLEESLTALTVDSLELEAKQDGTVNTTEPSCAPFSPLPTAGEGVQVSTCSGGASFSMAAVDDTQGLLTTGPVVDSVTWLRPGPSDDEQIELVLYARHGDRSAEDLLSLASSF